MLRRDLRAGELGLVVAAILLAVAALTAVGFFADRLQAGLARDARQLLGGDVVVVSGNPTPPQFAAQARALGLQVAATVSFPTMARADEARGGATRLVALKAVSPGYPLRGRVRVAQSPGEAGAPTAEIPARGEAWVDAPLLDALALQVGDLMGLGDSQLRISRVITAEPDRGAGFMSFAPRVMIHEGDLAATGLVQPASRLTWRLAVAGGDPAVKRFQDWAQAQIQPVTGSSATAPARAAANAQTEAESSLRGVRLESMEAGRPEMRQTLDRASKFLHLVALLAALLSAVAVALAARGFASRHLDDCAMLRVLGQSQAGIARAYAFEFGLVGLAASALGVALGFAVHFVFVQLLAGLVEATLPLPGAWPALFGLGVGLTLLVAFGLPPVLQLAQVPPLRVIRRDLGGLKPASLGVLGLGVAGFAALLLAASRDPALGGIAVGGFAVAVLLFAGLAALALRLLRRAVNEATAPRWLVLATRQVAARPAYTVVQVSALAVGMLALVLLVLIRTDLISSWRRATPPDAPNRFVINVQPEQAQDFQQTLARAGVARYDWYPMIRGRLLTINGRPVSPDQFDDDRARRLVDREFNLSHSAEMPAHNQVVSGRWQPGDASAISMEEGIAQTLGLSLGDTLVFDIGGLRQESRITSLRKVDWGSMRANFFAMYTVAQMPNLPATYISAFRAPPQPGFDNALVRAFPNITNIDMSATLGQVQRVLDQVIQAVEFLFGFTLAAGLVVLFAAITATREERAREFAIMRAVGARASLLRQVQRAELIGVGLLAGFLAASVASVVGWALARWVFDFSWRVSPWVPLGGALAGALLAWAAGWWTLREVLRQPVAQTLRRAAE
ncbi:MAG: ABC transporter permease [Ramlibacter sp.]|uniref:ABC transporter permease n=1 Tax=Ramlibacter sp. TaxID=1917967 RepID=UPI00261E420D|nr:FtsX-like permease family protein [Ramlibacter sp.]MDH4377078.1 ABC transporter permease [Ramlibacter sp.]